MSIRHAFGEKCLHMLLRGALAWAACGCAGPPPPPDPVPLVETRCVQKALAKIEFEQTLIHRDHVAPSEHLEFVYRFQNLGPAKLKIESVKETCSACSNRYYPRDSVAVGETDSVVVECVFNDPGVYKKSSTLKANTDPPCTLLRYEGEVVEPKAGKSAR